MKNEEKGWVGFYLQRREHVRKDTRKRLNLRFALFAYGFVVVVIHFNGLHDKLVNLRIH